MKKYYDCTVTAHDGRKWNNPLTLSESHLIGKMARENAQVVVTVQEMTIKAYNSTFGTSLVERGQKDGN